MKSNPRRAHNISEATTSEFQASGAQFAFMTANDAVPCSDPECANIGNKEQDCEGVLFGVH